MVSVFVSSIRIFFNIYLFYKIQEKERKGKDEKKMTRKAKSEETRKTDKPQINQTE